MKMKREGEEEDNEQHHHHLIKKQKLIETTPSSQLAFDNALLLLSTYDDDDEDDEEAAVNNHKNNDNNNGKNLENNGNQEEEYDDEEEEEFKNNRGRGNRMIEIRRDCPYLDTVNRQTHALEYKRQTQKRKRLAYTGMAQYVSAFLDPGDSEYAPPVVQVETRDQKKTRIHNTKLERGAIKAAEGRENFDPHNDPNISGNPYNTLFVSRLSYETTESEIIKAFEKYGPIKEVSIVADKDTNKPRGYAFIEYMHRHHMEDAYTHAAGTKIRGRDLIVDFERGRTFPNWIPRRLGGGLGTTRAAGDLSEKCPGRNEKSGEWVKQIQRLKAIEHSNDKQKRYERDKHMDR